MTTRETDPSCLIGAFMTPHGVMRGWLVVADGLISEITRGSGRSPGLVDGVSAVVLPERSLAVPGYIDMHVHGGAGITFGSQVEPQAARTDVLTATAFHGRHGTTTMTASLVSAPIEQLVGQLRALTPAVHEGLIAGVHLEGPFLSGAWRGAHDPAHLLDPTPGRLAQLLDAADGVMSCMTIAPERDGAIEAIATLVSRGVVAAIGHTGATYDQALAAVDAGAAVFTHLFNGMAPLHHRGGGPVLAAQTQAHTVVELIVDGAHLDDEIVRWQFDTLGPHRIALVTDAIAAAGSPDGRYELGGLDVVVRGGRAQLAGGSTLAGSTATMADVVRRCVRAGVPLADAVTASSATPAAALGLTDRGLLVPGMRADIAVLDSEQVVRAVMRRGRWS